MKYFIIGIIVGLAAASTVTKADFGYGDSVTFNSIQTSIKSIASELTTIRKLMCATHPGVCK